MLTTISHFFYSIQNKLPNGIFWYFDFFYFSGRRKTNRRNSGFWEFHPLPNSDSRWQKWQIPSKSREAIAPNSTAEQRLEAFSPSSPNSLQIPTSIPLSKQSPVCSSSSLCMFMEILLIYRNYRFSVVVLIANSIPKL